MVRFHRLTTSMVLTVALSFATHAFANSGVSGLMMVVKGDVTVISADGKSEKAKVGKKVFPGDTIVAGPDSRAKIVMTDKNTLNISPDSKIVIEKYENNPAKDERNVSLNVMYGKVRATVEQKYDGDKNKFNVKTPAAVAGVRGTDFLTSYNSSTQQSKIVTFGGVVAVGKPGPGGRIEAPVFVRPGQMTSASVTSAPSVPAPVPKEELSSMNNESRAETAPAKSEPQQEQKSEEKKDEAKEEAKAEEKKEAQKEEAKQEEKQEAKKEEGKAEEKQEAKKDEPKQEEKKEAKQDEKKVEEKKEAKKEEPKQESKQEAKKDEPKQEQKQEARREDPKPEKGQDSAKQAENKPDQKKPDQANNKPNGPNQGKPEGPRGPASQGPGGPPPTGPSGCAMCGAGDLPSANRGPGPMPNMPVGGPGPTRMPYMPPPTQAMMPVMPPTMVNNPILDNIIKNTRSRVFITIQPQ